LYEYKCLKCGRLTEKIENVSGPHLKKVPALRRQSGGPHFGVSHPVQRLGWYVTDYAAKKSGSDTHKDDNQRPNPKTPTRNPPQKIRQRRIPERKDSGSKEKKADKSEKPGKSEKKK